MKGNISTKVLVIYFLLFVFLIILIVPEEYLKQPSIIGEVLGIVRILGTNAPFFDPPLTNFTVNQTDPFFYDVNCSDIDPVDPTSYLINTTILNISNSTGIIDHPNGFSQGDVGNHTFEFVCRDTFGLNATQTIQFVILDVNEPPVLSSIGPQIATEGELFTLDLSATDPENDILTFGEDTTLFVINPSTGVVSFTPTLGQVGNYSINFTVFDGELYDHEIVSFTIVRGPFCGDGTCGSAEACDTCPTDCGVCPVSEGGGETGEGQDSTAVGSGGGGQTSAQTGSISVSGASASPLFRCDESWECSEWSICSIEGLRTRECIDINRCNTQEDKPIEVEECDYQPTCFDGIQNGGETGIDCGGLCEPCLIESCFDGIQNQGETGIDCGGPCKSCEEKEFTKAPFLEIPGIIKIPRQFPWILLLLIAFILTATIWWDQRQIKKFRQLPFDEYREEIRKYRPFRRKLYKFVLNTSGITLLVAFYIYIFSNNLTNMMRFAFIPIILIALTPFGVSYLIRYMEYFEYQRIKKEAHMKRTHIREILQLIRIENEVLFGLENKLKEKIVAMAKKHEFDENPDIYEKFNEIFGDISILRKKRAKRMEILQISSTALDKMIAILESQNLERAVKEYPEYLSIKKELQYIEDNKDRDTTAEEDDLMEDIEELSMPYMKTVNESDKGLTVLYNALVDLHEHYLANHDLLKQKDSEIVQVERSFSDKVKALSKKAPIMTKIQQNVTYSKLYNSMVDLFNHYMKKHQLSKALDNV